MKYSLGRRRGQLKTTSLFPEIIFTTNPVGCVSNKEEERKSKYAFLAKSKTNLLFTLSQGQQYLVPPLGSIENEISGDLMPILVVKLIIDAKIIFSLVFVSPQSFGE